MNAPAEKLDVPLEVLSNVDKVANFLFSLPEEQHLGPRDFKLTEYITAHNQYAREIFLPAGTLILSHVKIHDGITVLSHGIVTEITIDGAVNRRAPSTWIHPPDSRRAFYCHTTAVLVTFHDEKTGITPGEIARLESSEQAKELSCLWEDNV